MDGHHPVLATSVARYSESRTAIDASVIQGEPGDLAKVKGSGTTTVKPQADASVPGTIEGHVVCD